MLLHEVFYLLLLLWRQCEVWRQSQIYSPAFRSTMSSSSSDVAPTFQERPHCSASTFNRDIPCPVSPQEVGVRFCTSVSMLEVWSQPGISTRSQHIPVPGTFSKTTFSELWRFHQDKDTNFKCWRRVFCFQSHKRKRDWCCTCLSIHDPAWDSPTSPRNRTWALESA